MKDPFYFSPDLKLTTAPKQNKKTYFSGCQCLGNSTWLMFLTRLLRKWMQLRANVRRIFMSSYLVFIVLWVLHFICFSHYSASAARDTETDALEIPTSSCFHKVHILTVTFHCHQKMQTPWTRVKFYHRNCRINKEVYPKTRHTKSNNMSSCKSWHRLVHWFCLSEHDPAPKL